MVTPHPSGQPRRPAPALDRHSTTIRLHEILEAKSRLEAAAFALDRRNAVADVRAAGPAVPLYGVDGLAHEAHNAFRFKRIYVAPDRGVPFLSSSDIIALRPEPTNFLSRTKTKRLDELIVREHDVLISRSGTVGNVALAGQCHTGKAASEDVIRVRCVEPADAGYVAGFLRGRYGRPQLTGAAYGSVVQHIEPHHLERVWVPDPGPEERRRLGAEMVEAAQRRDRANDLLDEADRQLRAALGVSALPAEGAPTRTVRASALADRFEANYHASLPAAAEASLQMAGVQTARLDTFAEVRAVTKFRKRVYVEKGGIPMLSSKQLFQVDPVVIKRLAKGAHTRDLPEIALETEMVLVTRSGTIGKVQIVPPYMDGWTASEHALRIVIFPGNDAGYLYAWLASGRGEALIKRHTYGSVIQQIDLDQLASVPVPMLPEGETARIGGLVREANRQRDLAWHQERAAIAAIEALVA